MKHRTRPMINEDDLMNYEMSGAKKLDNDLGEIHLHKFRPQEHYIEAQVQEGDTLQAIALRFYCSISELKRINQIHKDNEIFARRTIKVPVTPFSVLTELLPTSSASDIPSTSNSVTSPSLQGLLQNNELTILPAQNSQADETSIDCNSVILNSKLAPTVVPYTDVDEDITEGTHLLPNKEKVPVEAVVVQKITSQGADFGLKWFHLVCIILILAVVIPLLYVISSIHQSIQLEDTPKAPLGDPE